MFQLCGKLPYAALENDEGLLSHVREDRMREFRWHREHVGQGWKIRFPSDRIIQMFAHQNSIEILSEFSKIITIFQEFWQILELLKIF